MTTVVGPPRQARFEQDLDALSRFVEAGEPGWTRRVFGPAFAASRPWVAETMADAGLDVRVDAAGNTIGVLAGGDPDAAPLVSGSHTDTVAGGGRFDGILGVLGAVEVARSLREQGIRLARDLVVVDFLGEEPNDFGLSCVGSRAIAGALGEEHLALRDAQGRRLADGFADLDIDPASVDSARWDTRPLAFVELHIEQGPRLEQAQVPIGVVDAIAGISRFRGTFTGRPDHAGTTPMGVRRDAACAAAESVVALEALACSGGGVATAGRLDLQPGSLNVVPELARLWGEVRSADAAWLRDTCHAFGRAVDEAGRRRRVGAELAWLSETSPTPCAADLQLAIERAAEAVGQPTMRLPSGAGHDAVLMASIAPVAMVFVPSRDGRSHVPEEWTDPGLCAHGIHVLAQTLVELDAVGAAAT